jgi:chaperone required for assembly of F1-ATPase
MKRFYKEVSVAPADDGFAVLLDGRPVKTPARNKLVLPTEKLAAGIAAEWRGQGEEIIATSMPLLRLANSVIDGVTAKRDEVSRPSWWRGKALAGIPGWTGYAGAMTPT